MSPLPNAAPAPDPEQVEGRAVFKVPTGRTPYKRPEPVKDGDKVAEKAAEVVGKSTEIEDEPEKQQAEPHRSPKTPKWVPKEEWKGDPDDWVSEKEFKKRQELYDGLKNSHRSERETKEALAALSEQNRKLSEALRKASLGEKLKQRDEAIAAGDRERTYGIEREMQEIDSSIPKLPQAQTPQQDPEMGRILQSWASKNDWFNKDPELHYAAIGIHQKQLDSGDLRPLDEKLDAVTAEIRRRFPDKFGGALEIEQPERQVRRGAVETPNTQRIGGKRRFNFSDLNEMQQQVCKKLVRRGTLKEQDYIDQLVAIGELK